VNLCADTLVTFFRVNGYRKGRELEVEKHHVPARYRKTEEYVPSREEVWNMADSWGRNPAGLRNRAIALTLLSAGLRNSTLRAVLCENLNDELASGKGWALLHIRPEMKRTVKGACKGDIPYYVFLFPECAEVMEEWLRARAERFGPIVAGDPVFCPLNGTQHWRWEALSSKPISKHELQRVVKESARRAGIKQWRAVHPHCLRKTFEFVLRDARKDGTRMDVKTQEFFMGHILPGAQDTYYDSSKIEWMRQEFSLLSFKRESKEVKELREELERKDEEIENLARRQERFERTVLEALLVGKIPSLTLEVLERTGYEVMRNPDGSYTLKK
jgi:integrase